MPPSLPAVGDSSSPCLWGWRRGSGSDCRRDQGRVGVEEGFEVNLLGLVFGVDPLGPAIKLPGIGRIGFGGARV